MRALRDFLLAPPVGEAAAVAAVARPDGGPFAGALRSARAPFGGVRPRGAPRPAACAARSGRRSAAWLDGRSGRRPAAAGRAAARARGPLSFVARPSRVAPAVDRPGPAPPAMFAAEVSVRASRSSPPPRTPGPSASPPRASSPAGHAPRARSRASGRPRSPPRHPDARPPASAASRRLAAALAARGLDARPAAGAATVALPPDPGQPRSPRGPRGRGRRRRPGRRSSSAARATPAFDDLIAAQDRRPRGHAPRHGRRDRGPRARRAAGGPAPPARDLRAGARPGRPRPRRRRPRRRPRRSVAPSTAREAGRG